MRPSWLRLPQPTIRLRLTAIYAAIFGVCGVALVLMTFALTAEGDVLFPGLGIGVIASKAGTLQNGTQKLPPGLNVPATPPPFTAAQNQALQVAIDNKRTELLEQLALGAGIALAITLLIACLLSWLAAGRVLRPLRSITATARRLSQRNLHERIALEGPRDELRDLSETLDTMLDRLEAAFESQRRFVANASHELRTPLTRERALVDVTLGNPKASSATLRAMAERVRSAVDEQERLIEGLLTLARGEQVVDRLAKVDLAAIARRSVGAIDNQPDHADGIRIATSLHPAKTVGDPELIERTVVNLVDNALAYNVSSGRIEIGTRTEGGEVVFEISNTGPVIASQAVPGLFEPFRRGGTDRTDRRGNGLGLSIVAAVVASHKGSIVAEPNSDGGGLNIQIRLPGPGTADANS